jgi:glucose-6-phosphate 1-dehydrogenase
MLVGRLDSFLATLDDGGAHAGSDGWKRLRERISYTAGDFTKDEVFLDIKARLAKAPSGNAAFYLAVPPQFFGTIVEKLAEHGLTSESDSAFRRIAIEKPFGTDLASAKALNARILAKVSESQVYRLDHFLGKETVQNILTTRFANMMIEALWNNNYIDHVQITAAETVDVGSRGKFYDATGALRDMVPNHLFQLLAMIAMEAPNGFGAEAIRSEKSKALSALRIYTPEEAPSMGCAAPIPAARSTATRHRLSRDQGRFARQHTETFVALKLYVDTWRWAGVPFYLRTGKAMTARDTEIVVTFRQVPFAQFRETDIKRSLPPNRLVIQVQPDEGLSIELSIKSPGLSVDTVPVSLDFRYADKFDIGKMTGYESLLYDLFIGDQTLFQRADGIEAGWAAVQPFLDMWAKAPNSRNPTSRAAWDRPAPTIDPQGWAAVA